MIERLLGTPTEEMWPGVKSLRYWHIYPEWKPKNLASVFPNFSLSGLDLLSVCYFSLKCKIERYDEVCGYHYIV